MKREEHEALLSELLSEEIETSRKTEILQSLREDYGSTLTTLDETTNSLNDYKAKHADLVESNSKLFRQLGSSGKENNDPEDVKKERAETITIEDLEKGGNN